MDNDGGDLLGGKPGNRVPQFKKQKNKTRNINLDIYAMIIASLTVLNGRAAILCPQTRPY